MGIDIKDIERQQGGSQRKSGNKGADSPLQSLLQKEIHLFGKGLGFRQKEDFYSRLSVLLHAGLDLRNSLRLLAESQKKKKVREVYSRLQTNLEEGASLSDAMRAADAFSDYEVFSIRIGEETGRLVIVLRGLAEYYNKALGYRRQLVQALSYPSFVVGFSILVVAFLLNYLVPMFGEVYQRFDGDLPAITKAIIALSDAVGDYGGYAALAFGGLLLLWYTFRKRPAVRRMGAFLLLRMPIFGGIIKRIYLTRFCSAMQLLLASGVPLLRATGLVRQMVGFWPIESSLEKVGGGIMKGEALHHALSEHRFYPIELTSLIRVGEESGQLAMMFDTLAKQYSAETEQRTAVIGSLLEPVLIIFLGVVVGFILVAMYLPMFKMSTEMGF